MEEGTVRLGAALGLTLPVARHHVPLLTPNIQVTVNTVVLRALPLLQQQHGARLRLPLRRYKLTFQYMQTVSLLRARGSCLKGQSVALVQVL